MERLTVPAKKLDDGRTVMPIIDGRAVREHAMDLYWRLKEYEDLEQQGRLLVLPCKVGDKLYLLQENNRKHEVVEVEVDRFEYAKYRVPRLEIYFTNASGFETCLLDGTLNEGVFLTKAKAEKALAEMRKSNEA